MSKKHPEHQVARSCLQRRTFEQEKTSHTEDRKKKRKWGGIGHTLRKPEANITSLELKPTGQKKS